MGQRLGVPLVEQVGGGSRPQTECCAALPPAPALPRVWPTLQLMRADASPWPQAVRCSLLLLRPPLQGLSEERQLWRSGVRVNLLGTRVTAPKCKAE